MKINWKSAILLLAICALFFQLELFGVERFPPPDFDPNIYKMPTTTTPPPRAHFWEFVDILLLFSALSLATYFVLIKRSRRHVFWLTIFSLLYFGFIRQGCICPIGSIQNVTLALFRSDYAVPFSVVFFFLTPLVFALFFGRVFCAAVCPLGMIQDVVVWKPVKIKPWLEQTLRIIPFIYLGAAVLFAASGSAFIICEYDPFISFFRLSGNVKMLALGAVFLVVGMYIGRPYCRFLCPYGALLSLISRISKWNVVLTEQDCIRCQICDVACPFGAIATPSETSMQSENTNKNTHITGLIILTVFLTVLGALGGSKLAVPFSKMNYTVRVAERIAGEESGKYKEPVDETKAFRQTGQPIEELYKEALSIRGWFAKAGSLFGAFIGFIIGIKLIGLRIAPVRTVYEPDRANCVACARCYAYCPKELVRLKRIEKAKVKV